MLEALEDPDPEVRARVERILARGFLGALLEVRAETLLSRYWPERSEEIREGLGGGVPLLVEGVRGFGPGEPMPLGDDGGTIVYSRSQAEIGRSGREVGLGYHLQLGPGDRGARGPETMDRGAVAGDGDGAARAVRWDATTARPCRRNPGARDAPPAHRCRDDPVARGAASGGKASGRIRARRGGRARQGTAGGRASLAVHLVRVIGFRE